MHRPKVGRQHCLAALGMANALRHSVLIALLLASGASLAHHSTAAYDMRRDVAIDGTVQEYQWTNPHSWIKVQAIDSDGVAKVWSLEFGTPSLSIRTGWTPSTFKPGDKARFVFHPRFDGALSGVLSVAILDNGKTLRGSGAAGPPAAATAPAAGTSPP